MYRMAEHTRRVLAKTRIRFVVYSIKNAPQFCLIFQLIVVTLCRLDIFLFQCAIVVWQICSFQSFLCSFLSLFSSLLLAFHSNRQTYNIQIRRRYQLKRMRAVNNGYLNENWIQTTHKTLVFFCFFIIPCECWLKWISTRVNFARINPTNCTRWLSRRDLCCRCCCRCDDGTTVRREPSAIN